MYESCKTGSMVSFHVQIMASKDVRCWQIHAAAPGFAGSTNISQQKCEYLTSSHSYVRHYDSAVNKHRGEITCTLIM